MVNSCEQRRAKRENSQTTEDEMMAFSAEDEPRKMQPKMMTQPVQKRSAGIGTSCFLSTRDRMRENGRPPARQYVKREWNGASG